MGVEFGQVEQVLCAHGENERTKSGTTTFSARRLRDTFVDQGSAIVTFLDPRASTTIHSLLLSFIQIQRLIHLQPFFELHLANSLPLLKNSFYLPKCGKPMGKIPRSSSQDFSPNPGIQSSKDRLSKTSIDQRPSILSNFEILSSLRVEEVLEGTWLFERTVAARSSVGA